MEPDGSVKSASPFKDGTPDMTAEEFQKASKVADREKEVREHLTPALREQDYQRRLREFAHFLAWRYHAITYGSRIFLYREAEGVFSPDRGEVESETLAFLNETEIGITRGRSMKTAVQEVKVALKAGTRWLQVGDPFNSDPTTIPCQNGVVRVGTDAVSLEGYSPDLRLTFRLPITYDRLAPREEVIEVLQSWMEEKEMVLVQIPAQALLQRAGTTYKKSYIIEGETNTGKTTYVSLLEEFFFGPDVVSKVSFQRICYDRFAFPPMEHRIINIFDDLSAVTVKDAGTFKVLTGASRHSIERKGVDSYESVVNPVHCFTCNKPPKITNMEPAIIDRFYYLIFSVEKAKDTGWKERTFTPLFLSGFLNLIIEMMQVIVKDRGLPITQEPDDTERLWRAASDEVMATAIKHTDPDSKGFVVFKDFMRAVESVCRDAKKPIPTETRVGRALREMGYSPIMPEVRGKQVRAYRGIRWKPDSPFKVDYPQMEVEQKTLGENSINGS